MKASEIKKSDDVRKYVRKSTSWLKGYLATVRKWELLRINKWDGCGIQSCGFCYVANNVYSNIQGKYNTRSTCQLCPIHGHCTGLGNDADKVLRKLKDNKDLIINHKS